MLLLVDFKKGKEDDNNIDEHEEVKRTRSFCTTAWMVSVTFNIAILTERS